MGHIIICKQPSSTSGLSLMNEGVGQAEGNSPLRHVWVWLVDHSDAINDWADRETQCAPRAVTGDVGQVGLGVKGYRLVARIIADHVALSTVDAHVFVDDCDDLLCVVHVAIGTNHWQGTTYHILYREQRAVRSRLPLLEKSP